MSQQIPGIPKPLIEWLEKAFPNHAPSLKDTDREVWASVGRQEVISLVRAHYNKQNANNTVLKETP